MEQVRSVTRIAGRRTELALTVVTALICLALLAWTQYSFHHLHDGDSYFHVRAAQQLSQGGIRKQFPQAAFSTWSDAYSDKDFLFHVALIPFVGRGEDLIPGGKLAVVCFDALVLLALVLALHGLEIRFGPVWILLLLGSNAAFVAYLMSVRPHLLSNALILVEVLLLLRGHWKALFALSVIHVLAHSSFVLLPGMAACQLVVHRLQGTPAPWKALLAVTLGIVGASLLHPYFPNNLTVAFDQIVGVASNVWDPHHGIPRDLFGGELLPLQPAIFLGSIVGWLPAAAGCAALSLVRGRGRPSAWVPTLALITASFLVLSLLSARFSPLFLSVAVLLAGLTWSRVAGSRTLLELWRGGRHAKMAIAFLVVCVIVGQFPVRVVGVAHVLRSRINEYVFANAVDYLEQHAAREDVVYHNFWWSFSGLYYHRPHGRYIVALDPIFLYRFDAQRFHRMLLAFRGAAPDVYEVVAADFGARWIFATKLPREGPFLRLVRKHPKIRLRYQDAYTEVYEALPDRDPHLIDRTSK